MLKLWGIPFGIGIGIGMIAMLGLLIWLQEPAVQIPVLIQRPL